jgi:hypothetical protein
MKRAPWLLLFLWLASAQPLKAQLYVGVEGGWNRNYLTTSNNSQYFTEYKSQAGFSAGIPVLYRFTDWLAVQADPSYLQKNYKIERTGFFTGIYQRNTNGYLQLPLMAQFSFGGKELRGFVNLGGYAAYWMSGRVKGTEPNILNPVDTAFTTVNAGSLLGENYSYSYDEKYTFNNTRDRRLELGAIAGLGVSYEWKATYLFFVEGRYTRSLTDQQKQYETNQTPRYNDTFGLSAGCLLQLNHFIGHKSKQ